MAKQTSAGSPGGTPKRWDLHLGGTNVLPPLGTQWEPWPEWLSKTFVNIHVLQSDPIVLRNELLQGHGPDEWWGIIDALLCAIERDAREILKKDLSCLDKRVLLPEGYVSLETIVTKRNLASLTEHKFWNLFGYEKLTPKQANAIAALRSIALIRSEFFYQHRNGYYFPVKDADFRNAKILIEMMMLTIAAIRGELWEELWLHADKNAKRQRHLRETSSKGNAARKNVFEPIKQFCRDRWSLHQSKGQRAVHDLHKELRAELKKPPSLRIAPLNQCGLNQKPPSVDTIRTYIKILR